MKDIYPYFHPTRVLLIDDDISFLNSLSSQLEKAFYTNSYTNTKQALIDINTQYNNCVEQCHGKPKEQFGSLSAQLVPWDFSFIKNRVLEPERFNEISIVVTDYDMPAITGLGLCERITNSQVKKILLTGVYDLNQGVEALNAGIICAYFRKNDPSLVEKLNQIIENQQQAYFAAIKNHFYATGANLPAFLNDLEFKPYFTALYEKYDVCEYYMTTAPYGMLMLGNNKRDYWHLLIYTEEEMKSQQEIAQDQDAPVELLDQLRERRLIPNFYKTEGFYDPVYADRWRDYTYKPTQIIDGQFTTYYCHLGHQSPAYKALCDDIIDYDSFYREPVKLYDINNVQQFP